MFRKFRNELASHHANIGGWTTNRKLVVIESDDWGSIRMPSAAVYAKMLKKGIRVDNCPYNRNDSLASEEDLTALFDVLVSFKDKHSNHPIITANAVMANPNFDKIEQSEFKEYYYEPFIETLKRYPKHQNSFTLWMKGIEENVFFPQFHGREHVNINLWLKLLQSKNKIFLDAFKSGFWGLGPSIVKTGRINIQASFDAYDLNEINQHKLIIEDGLQLFHDLFGFKSKSFIANNFIWDSELNQSLADFGINIFQGMKYQRSPIFNNDRRKQTRHKIGESNSFNQTYLVRNCHFEPSVFPKTDSINSCLKDINNAFFWRKPAIISSHRINFIGGIRASNRTNNLKSLDRLLHSIIKNWPEVEFMTSLQLGNLIESQKI